MMTQNIQALVTYRIEQADESLEAATKKIRPNAFGNTFQEQRPGCKDFERLPAFIALPGAHV